MNLKIFLLKEEKQAQQVASEKRFNQATKDFVKRQKESADELRRVKALAKIEVAVHDTIRTKMQIIID